MPVFALYNFDDVDTHALDSALGNGPQDGIYLNGASAAGGQAVLDGINDFIKIYPNPAFQMDRGTLDITFTLADTALDGTQTVLSRDSLGENPGGFRIEIQADGSVVVSHETASDTVTFTTAPGFANPGDAIDLTYSWDLGGAGGQLVIENTTTGGTHTDDVPNTLGMDQGPGGMDQPWIIGAGQANSNPYLLNNIDQHFEGQVAMFQLSDTVDTTPTRDGIVRGTDAGDLIDVNYIDPFDADRVDANDAILPGDVGNDDVIVAGGGDDTVLAGDGDDEVAGGTGNDSVVGGVGDDTVNGDAGNDTISGGTGNDVLEGADGNDVLDGGADNDTLSSGNGNDTVDGGFGNDVINTTDSTSSPDRAYPGLYTADTDPNDDRDNVTGGSGDDTITTGDDADTISGGDGNDQINAGDDADLVSAGDGNDMVLGQEGSDTITGDIGNDTIYGGSPDDATDPTHQLDAVDPDTGNNRDSLTGGAGNDAIYGGDDDDTLEGGNGADLLNGGIDEDSLLGGAGNDTLYGGQGADTVTGGGDRDVIIGANAGDVVDGSENGDDYDTLDLRGLGPLTVAYDPLNAENGVVTFLDGAGNPTGTMSFVNIENVLTDNGDPTANPDVAETDEDTPVTIPVLTNDTDPTGQPLTVTTATSPNGTITINPNGTLNYTPDPDFNGTDTITYTVEDPDGNTSTSTVTVTVNPVNDAPVATDDASTTPLNTPVTFAVLGNDSDVDGDTLSISGIPTSPNGTVTVNGNGTLTFTPNPGFTGVATVNYTVTDPEGLTDTAVWTITVEDAVNQPPVANDDTASTAVDTPVNIIVLANDSDPDGDPLVFVGTPTSADGTVVVNPDGTITFTPNPGFVGEATIDYLITDGNGGTDPAVVTVTVVDPGTRDGIVRGTTGDDLIDYTYPNDNDGDFVDTNDAILPGDAPQDDRILAGAGNDTVAAGQGDDSVEGGTGNDLINGANGNDTIFGQDGNDTLIGQNGDDTLFGGNGRDSVRAGSGDDVVDTSGDPTPLPDKGYPGIYPSDLDPNDDRDTVWGGDGNDTIITGDDADVIGGGAGNDSLDGGFDDDTISGNEGNDTIIGAEGNDAIDAGYGDDLVYGGYGPNVPDAVNIPDDGGDLRPDNGRDNIRGGIGNDTIFGMDDDDTIDGGQDDDFIDAGIDDDLVTGGTGNDSILGGQGNDTVDGGQGNDTVTGGAGTDSLSGGADRDIFIVGSQPNGTGDVVFGGSGGDDWDTLDLRGAGPYRLTGVTPDSDGNGIDGTVEFLDGAGNVTGTMTFTNIEDVIPCFTPGTLIATPKGEVPVESLKAGDRVITRDNGIQEIRWTGQKALGWKDLAANPHLKPVLIRQGSLGNGLPERDMMVSPNHRMLVANDRTALYFDEHEVLVAAKHLVAANGIQSIDSIGTTYLHFMFDRHEVVLSNGAWTESFQPGDYTLKGMGNSQRNEIFELFPELKTEAGLNDYQAARRTLKKHEARLLVK